MKTASAFISFLLFTGFTLYAQGPNFTDYGNPGSYEMSMKTCTFDSDANAVILLHEAFSNYDDQSQLITDHHIRIKILNEKGISTANIKIPYYRKDGFEHIHKIEGMTINSSSGGSTEKLKLDKKSIYDSKTNAYWGEVNFAFPSVRSGSIIEYKYQSVMKSYGGLENWDFQETLPVMMSKYLLVIVPNAEFAYRVYKTGDYPIVVKPDFDKGQIYFEMQNIPGLQQEPYMDARNDYLQKVVFQLSGFVTRGGIMAGLLPSGTTKTAYMDTWSDVIKKLTFHEDFGNELKKNIPGTNELMNQVANMSDENKMYTVHNYVRDNMTWNNLYSKYANSKLKTVWQKREGSSSEINLLLINLLREAGLESHPLLVSERFHGKVNADYPFLEQFNSVYACVIIGDKKYYLDATDKYTPANLTPYSILNTTALLVSIKRGGIISISNENKQYDELVNSSLEISATGEVTGKVTVESRDYARVRKLSSYKRNKGDFMNSFFEKNEEGFSIKEFKVVNENVDSLPLEQHAEFSCKSRADGNYDYIRLDMFSEFKTNPFIAENRFSNINFGYKRNISLITEIKYPANYEPDAVPKPERITNTEKDIVITRQFEHDKENRVIFCTINLQFKNGLYNVESYPVLKEIYKKMFQLLKEPFLFRIK